MQSIKRWLLVTLFVLAFLMVFQLIGMLWFQGGRWYERKAQAEADKIFSTPRNEDGSVTVQNGDEEITFHETEYKPATYRFRDSRAREREPDRRFERAPSAPRSKPHCSGSYHYEKCEHQSSRRGRRQKLNLPEQ